MAACALSVVPDPVVYGREIVLKSKLAAIQIQPDSGSSQFGLFVHLPSGARVQVCGAGFSERTVQVRYVGSHYFVLLDSLNSTQPS